MQLLIGLEINLKTVVSMISMNKIGLPEEFYGDIPQRMLKQLIDNCVCLEICPDSNVDTCAVSCIEEHPIKKIVDAGVCVCISTDNRTVSETSLEHEYELLNKTFNFTEDDKKQLQEAEDFIQYLETKEK